MRHCCPRRHCPVRALRRLLYGDAYQFASGIIFLNALGVKLGKAALNLFITSRMLLDKREFLGYYAAFNRSSNTGIPLALSSLIN